MASCLGIHGYWSNQRWSKARRVHCHHLWDSSGTGACPRMTASNHTKVDGWLTPQLSWEGARRSSTARTTQEEYNGECNALDAGRRFTETCERIHKMRRRSPRFHSSLVSFNAVRPL